MTLRRYIRQGVFVAQVVVVDIAFFTYMAGRGWNVDATIVQAWLVISAIDVIGLAWLAAKYLTSA